MPNATEHALTGAIVGGSLYALMQWGYGRKINRDELISSAIAGGIGDLLTDKLEPATSPHHRSVFHSASAFGLCVYGYGMINNHSGITRGEKILLQGLLTGYATHIMQDSRTPFGVPLIHNKVI